MSNVNGAYRLQLIEERERLEAEGLQSSGDRRAVTLDQQSVGRLSRMDAMQQQAMAQAVERRRQARFQRIAAALQRIEDGEFGYCEDCGGDIAKKRLDHDPTASRCIDCARG